MTSREYALVVAAGKGTRFGSDTPKQFVELAGKPVVIHTLEAFYRYSEKMGVILVLPAEQIPVWKALAEKHNFRRPIILQEGGATRFQSVRRGLQCITADGYVAIHDGVRPLVSTKLIAESFQVAAAHGAAVAAVNLNESLRMVTSGDKSQALDRSRYRLVQTPQTFEVSLIKRAYEMEEDETLTDDASVAERAGTPVVLFQGDYRNIKITNRDDLAVAGALLSIVPGDCH